jgi:3-phytase
VLYLGVEDGGIHQIDAEPDGGVETELIAPVAPTGHLVPDVEGLALHYTAGGGGYLIASSQGSSDFVVYERGGDHTFVARFRIGDAGGIDAVTKTDGIEVSGLPLGPAFPNGLFIAQDDKNPGSQQNFKLVSWQDVATGTTPPLVIDTSVDPRR